MDGSDHIKGLPLKQLVDEPQRIFVVDDDESIRRLLSIFLESRNIEYFCADNGKTALEILEKQSFTIVIMDIVIPEIDGMELLKTIKKSWPDTDVIIMTAYTADFSYTGVISAGASDFLTKPFSLDELEAKINRIVRERRLRLTLRDMCIMDSLTELYNRRHFDHKIVEEAARAIRQGHSLFLLMVDVDNLKTLNDTKGHQEGDRILKILGSIIRQSIRENVDKAFRIGGDEFAVLIPYVSQKQAEIIAGRIRDRFFPSNPGKVSLSLGLAKLKDGDNPALLASQLVKDADKALYQAKNTGGNRLVVKESNNSGE